MATTKKPAKSSEAFQKLKTDLKEGTLGCAYLFYGEESYLREYYLEEVRNLLIPAGFEEFNYHKLEGKDLSVQDLAEMAEAMPMMAERTLLVVTDMDLFKLNEDQREKLIAFLEDIPPYCCVIFAYDTVEYKPNKTMKKLVKALNDHVEAVEFKAQDSSHLVAWIARRFKVQGKEIDRQTAEYLILPAAILKPKRKTADLSLRGSWPRRKAFLWVNLPSAPIPQLMWWLKSSV